MVSSITNGTSSMSLQQLFADMKSKMGAADTDGTQGLSKQELSSIDTGGNTQESNFLKTLSDNFDKIDSNGDGQISSNEIKAARPHHHGHMGPPPGMNIESTDSADSTTSTNATSSTDPTSSTSAIGIMDSLIKQLIAALEKAEAGISGQMSTNGNGSDTVASVDSTQQASSASNASLNTQTAGITKDDLASIAGNDGHSGHGFIKKLQENFDKIDTDSDGQLSKSEIKAFADSNSKTAGSDVSNAGSKIANISEYFMKQLVSTYQNNSAAINSALNIAV